MVTILYKCWACLLKKSQTSDFKDFSTLLNIKHWLSQSDTIYRVGDQVWFRAWTVLTRIKVPNEIARKWPSLSGSTWNQASPLTPWTSPLSKILDMYCFAMPPVLRWLSGWRLTQRTPSRNQGMVRLPPSWRSEGIKVIASEPFGTRHLELRPEFEYEYDSDIDLIRVDSITFLALSFRTIMNHHEWQ